MAKSILGALPPALLFLLLLSTALLLVTLVWSLVTGAAWRRRARRVILSDDAGPESDYMRGLRERPLSQLSAIDAWFAVSVRLEPKRGPYRGLASRYLEVQHARPDRLRELFAEAAIRSLPMVLVSMLWSLVLIVCVAYLLLRG
ncbi:MAG: hypothetical protein Q7W30_04400 [Coriobacteriia bacterium]|nr:hypothetical protein [Coriobacteriia bacterium]